MIIPHPPWSPTDASIGELLEKATRVLTAEEKLVLDQEWVGKDGTKRKLEVSHSNYFKPRGYRLIDLR